jgi:hypothetical protein
VFKSLGAIGRLGAGLRKAVSGGGAGGSLTAHVGVGAVVLKKTADTTSVGVGGIIVGNN